MSDPRKWSADERKAWHSFAAESLEKAADEIERLQARVDKLEAACTVQTEMAPERTVPEIWKALANSEVENNE